mgnify:CR=1 FL=1
MRCWRFGYDGDAFALHASKDSFGSFGGGGGDVGIAWREGGSDLEGRLGGGLENQVVGTHDDVDGRL